MAKVEFKLLVKIWIYYLLDIYDLSLNVIFSMPFIREKEQMKEKDMVLDWLQLKLLSKLLEEKS